MQSFSRLDVVVIRKELRRSYDKESKWRESLSRKININQRAISPARRIEDLRKNSPLASMRTYVYLLKFLTR